MTRNLWVCYGVPHHGRSYVDMNAPRLGSFSVSAGHDKTMSLENSGNDRIAHEKQYKVLRAF